MKGETEMFIKDMILYVTPDGYLSLISIGTGLALMIWEFAIGQHIRTEWEELDNEWRKAL